jgi:dTDP-3-amino-3,4,6-trideoxy-alpha-D-glucose transaminase
LIPLNDFQRQWRDLREDALAAFDAVGGAARYILGAEVSTFEEALARYWRAGCAVGVASGLDAIEIALRSLGCTAGDKVLTTPLSAFATTLAILKLGAVPVFADTDRFGLIDLDVCRDALESRRDVRFFVPVHLYGHALDRSRLAALRAGFDCRIVEDCAQSIGAEWDGRPTGTAGDAAAVSFYPTKNLGAMGDAGAILTTDRRIAEAAMALRDYGQSAKYRHELVGYNSRLDELQAAYLRRAALPRLAAWTDARRGIAARYIAEIRNEAICVPGAPAESNSCWHLFPVLVDRERKRDFLAWMHSRGVICGEHYPLLIPEQPAMAGVRFEALGDLATASRLARSEVSLPVHAYLREEEVSQVIDACNGWEG